MTAALPVPEKDAVDEGLAAAEALPEIEREDEGVERSRVREL